MANKNVKATVVSFRLNAAELGVLKKIREKQPMMGVDSHNLLARKVTLDYALGKLSYASEEDRISIPDVKAAR